MSYAEIVSEDGCFEVCYPKTRTRYGVPVRSSLSICGQTRVETSVAPADVSMGHRSLFVHL